MTNVFVKTAMAGLIAFAGLSGTASMAAASGPEFRIFVQHGNWDRHDRRDRGDRFDRHDRRRHHDRRGSCSPRQAESKARHMGLRRARVVDVDRRTVTVVGRDHGRRDRIIFANDRGCPVIRR